MKNQKVMFLTRAAMIAAVYVVLSVVFAPFGTKAVQVRISEALTILPVFSSAAVPGLFVGCLIGNMLAGSILPDMIFGSLATLIGALGTRALRRTHPVLGTFPPILSNMIIVPLVLRYGYGDPLPIPYMMLTVGIGEVISCGVLGMILYAALKPIKQRIFGSL